LNDQNELEEKLLRDVDTWLSPEEAIEYGIADIVEPGGRSSW
jgi:ATP-dependent Clp protease protease subunit